MLRNQININAQADIMNTLMNSVLTYIVNTFLDNTVETPLKASYRKVNFKSRLNFIQLL